MNNSDTALHQLNKLLDEQKSSYSIYTITSSLGRQSYAMILLLFSLPFAFPLTIPGLSTPFGVVLLFLSARFMWGLPFWLPPQLSQKNIKRTHLERFVRIVEKFLKKVRKILKPRLSFLFKTHLVTGFLLSIQSILMAMPIPLPLTNVFAALPLVLMGLGLLAHDGLFILLGYLGSLISIAFFVLLFWFGIEGLERISPF